MTCSSDSLTNSRSTNQRFIFHKFCFLQGYIYFQWISFECYSRFDNTRSLQTLYKKWHFNLLLFFHKYACTVQCSEGVKKIGFHRIRETIFELSYEYVIRVNKLGTLILDAFNWYSITIFTYLSIYGK